MSGGQRRPAHPVRDPRETPEVTDALTIPADLLPSDGRFGCGPSKVRSAQVDYLASLGPASWAPATARPRSRVWSARSAPACATSFAARGLRGHPGQRWGDGLLGHRRLRPRPRARQHLSLRRVLGKFASVTNKAPFLGESTIIKAEPGTLPVAVAEAGVDVYAWAHNETSTGVMAPINRVEGADATRSSSSTPPPAPAGSPVDMSQADVYYFAPQKCFASDGGLWWRCSPPPLSPASRRSRRAAAGCPTSSACPTAIDNSLKDQTYNTPASRRSPCSPTR
jgi:phosphoserine aminotransferase